MIVRRILRVMIIVCAVLSLISIVPATSPQPPVATHLVLAEKPHSGDNPADYSTWSFAMWGQLDYYTPWPTFDYAFDAHGLAASTNYVLLYYPDPYPGNGLICIDHGTSNATGGIILHGSTNIGSLPKAYDANINTGAKIWLVLSSDVDCAGKKMIAWQPTLYLFELWLIQYATALPTATVTSTIGSPTTTTVTISGATSTITLPRTTATVTLPGTTVTVASQTVTQTLTTTVQSTCPVTTKTWTTWTHTSYTHTETSHTYTTTTRTVTTTTNPSCRPRICTLHYTPIRFGGNLPYDVVVPCDAAWGGCYVYTDSHGQVWQVCEVTGYAPGTGPVCPIKNDC